MGSATPTYRNELLNVNKQEGYPMELYLVDDYVLEIVIIAENLQQQCWL